jgi:hypothetical protein
MDVKDHDQSADDVSVDHGRFLELKTYRRFSYHFRFAVAVPMHTTS